MDFVENGCHDAAYDRVSAVNPHPIFPLWERRVQMSLTPHNPQDRKVLICAYFLERVCRYGIMGSARFAASEFH